MGLEENFPFLFNDSVILLIRQVIFWCLWFLWTSCPKYCLFQLLLFEYFFHCRNLICFPELKCNLFLLIVLELQDFFSSLLDGSVVDGDLLNWVWAWNLSWHNVILLLISASLTSICQRDKIRHWFEKIGKKLWKWISKVLE